MSLYHLNVTIHVLAALLWLGGMFFLGIVGAPVLRHIDPPSLRVQLFRQLGERFRKVGWSAIGVLIVTGLLNLHFRGSLSPSVWLEPAFWSTRYGTALAWKLAAVVVMLTISGFHDFISGPAASRLDPRSDAAAAARKQAALLGRVNAVVGVILVVAAVRLARGG